MRRSSLTGPTEITEKGKGHRFIRKQGKETTGDHFSRGGAGGTGNRDNHGGPKKQLKFFPVPPEPLREMSPLLEIVLCPGFPLSWIPDDQWLLLPLRRLRDLREKRFPPFQDF
jgi:hypothetical protein